MKADIDSVDWSLIVHLVRSEHWFGSIYLHLYCSGIWSDLNRSTDRLYPRSNSCTVDVWMMVDWMESLVWPADTKAVVADRMDRYRVVENRLNKLNKQHFDLMHFLSLERMFYWRSVALFDCDSEALVGLCTRTQTNKSTEPHNNCPKLNRLKQSD